MRHTRLFRLMTALFGVWFTVTLVQPNGMSGMAMGGSGASMSGRSAPMHAGGATGALMKGSDASINGNVASMKESCASTNGNSPSMHADCGSMNERDTAIRAGTASVSSNDRVMEMSANRMAAMHHPVTTTESSADGRAPAQPTAPAECDQHDCCCSALSPISLMPDATLAWLPEHVVNQETPQSGDCVVHTDGQLLLPFANGPPRTVSA